MKKKFSILLALTVLALALFAGCSKESADAYAGKTITSLKEDKADMFSLLLEDGIAESNETYVLQFPEELKSAYLGFLQESFKSIDFEVQKAKKKDDGTYDVKISFTPLDLGATTEASSDAYVESLASIDLTKEVTALLKENTKAVQDHPQFDDEILAILTVTEDDKGFSISDEALKKFLGQVFINYMEPYNTICELLDVQDFLQAYLDASFKGDVKQFAKHTDRTEEEAVQWYEADTFDPPSDLNSAYTDRYKAALKNIMKQCKYTVGIPKKASGIYNYTLDVTYTPNTSLNNVMTDLEKGTYYSTKAVSKALVEFMEKYADTPSYGKESTMTIPLNLTAITTSGNDGSEYQKLAMAIFPIPE